MASMQTVKPGKSLPRYRKLRDQDDQPQIAGAAQQRLGGFDPGVEIMGLGIEAPDVALPVPYLEKRSRKHGFDRSKEIEIVGIPLGIEIAAAWIFAGNGAGQMRKINHLDNPGIVTHRSRHGRSLVNRRDSPSRAPPRRPLIMSSLERPDKAGCVNTS